MKKTALRRAILILKQRQSLYEGIDEEKASVIEECILDIENYLDVEQKQIIKAYKDGIEDMAIGQYYKPKHYYENNYGNQTNHI